jgi:hypothetical protein
MILEGLSGDTFEHEWDACIAIEMRKAGQAFRRFQTYHFQLVLPEVRGLELVKAQVWFKVVTSLCATGKGS